MTKTKELNGQIFSLPLRSNYCLRVGEISFSGQGPVEFEPQSFINKKKSETKEGKEYYTQHVVKLAIIWKDFS